MEASFLIPMIVTVVFLLLLLLFTVHNRSWYRAAACESVLKGSGWHSVTEDPYAAAWERMEERVREQPVPGMRPDISVQWTGGETVVYVNGQIFRSFGGKWFLLEIRENKERVHPAEQLRERWKG
ncbi:MAG: hypothetical protein Q4B22_00170 [Eubacteriales bacterium]|nr:hypothetical protein [Eubacteriales bacterium]